MKPIIRQYQSGITSVLFNTRDKWMEYDIYYGGSLKQVLTIVVDTYLNVYSGEHNTQHRSFVERMEIDLPYECWQCVKYVHQEKDQIEVLFVPRNMLTT